MTTLFQETKGFGRLRKRFGDPVVGYTDAQYRYPELPQRECPDATPRSYGCVTPTTTSGNDNDPQWDIYGLGECFVGEDPNTGLLVPVSQYATLAAFKAEAVGVMVDIVDRKQRSVSIFRKGVIRLYLATPATYNLNDTVGLEVDPATTKLHMFRAVLGVDAADSIGKPVHSSLVARNFVDVLFDL